MVRKEGKLEIDTTPCRRDGVPYPHLVSPATTQLMSASSFETLDALIAKLPFHLDDVEAVNDCYARWFDARSAEDRYLIDLWTYCFIRRYFLIKLVQESSMGPADFDDLVDRTFRKIESSEGRLKRPARFANWVSVICKNTFLNHLRDRRHAVSLDEAPAVLVAAEPAQAYRDVGHVRLAVHRAIDRLPPYLRECVRLRFIEGLSYDEISAKTGFPLPRIRSYINKAMKRFRQDDRLLAYLREEE